MDGVPYPRRPPVHPYILLTLAALFWADNVVLGRGVSGAIIPIPLNVLRWAIALALLLPIAWPQLAGKGQVVRKHFAKLVLLAVPSIAIYNTFLYIGTRTTTATNAGLIVGTMTIADIGSRVFGARRAADHPARRWNCHFVRGRDLSRRSAGRPIRP